MFWNYLCQFSFHQALITMMLLTYTFWINPRKDSPNHIKEFIIFVLFLMYFHICSCIFFLWNEAVYQNRYSKFDCSVNPVVEMLNLSVWFEEVIFFTCSSYALRFAEFSLVSFSFIIQCALSLDQTELLCTTDRLSPVIVWQFSSSPPYLNTCAFLLDFFNQCLVCFKFYRKHYETVIFHNVTFKG